MLGGGGKDGGKAIAPEADDIAGEGSEIAEQGVKAVHQRNFIMERRPVQVLDPHCRFTDIVTAGGARAGRPPVAALIVLPQLKKAGGSSDAPEPVSSNDVAATMALNSVRISGWWRSR